MPSVALPLSDWFVVSLRPVGGHATVQRAARLLGASVITLPGLRLRRREDATTQAALAIALDCDLVIFSSPTAVLSMPASQANFVRRKRAMLAVGSATATVLQRIGIESVITPAVETSEGLLALPALQRVKGESIGLVIAPGSRGLIASTLRARGAELRIAHVYARETARLTSRHLQSLLQAHGHGTVLITSAEALNNVMQRLSGSGLADQTRARLLECVAIVASARLDSAARAAGFARILRAASTRPRDMLDALRTHANAPGFR